MLLVDARRCLFEALPKRVFELGSHRAGLAPLLVQILQLTESSYHRGLHNECLDLLAELYLSLVVAFQIQIAQLFVYLDIVVEVLDVEVVGLPNLFIVGLRYHTGLFPALLQSTESSKGLVDGLAAIDELFQLLDNLQLNLQILLLDTFERRDILLACCTIAGKVLFESLLLLVGLRHKGLLRATLLDKLLAGSIDLSTV